MRSAAISGLLASLAYGASTGSGLEIEDGYNINMTLIDDETV